MEMPAAKFDWPGDATENRRCNANDVARWKNAVLRGHDDRSRVAAVGYGRDPRSRLSTRCMHLARPTADRTFLHSAYTESLENMGSHSHGHDSLEDPMKVQKPEFYKMENAPDLMKIHEKLEKKGLNDPWKRNHIWRYNPKYGTQRQRWGKMLFRGWKTGVAAFLITIGVEKALGIDYSHDHHAEDGEGGHH